MLWVRSPVAVKTELCQTAKGVEGVSAVSRPDIEWVDRTGCSKVKQALGEAGWLAF